MIKDPEEISNFREYFNHKRFTKVPYIIKKK